jgi:hypothetical protein
MENGRTIDIFWDTLVASFEAEYSRICLIGNKKA